MNDLRPEDQRRQLLMGVLPLEGDPPSEQPRISAGSSRKTQNEDLINIPWAHATVFLAPVNLSKTKISPVSNI